MARLFISHSSLNNNKAIEVRDWLAKNGWDDVFLDLDPERGIAAGQRWKEALQKAAWRCEVVLALVSKEWLASSWCKSEVDAARMMGKKVIAAVVGIDKNEVPPDLTDEQFIDLTGDPDAYRRLKEGLKRAGLDPTSFPFAPGRRPYPGFAYLEEQDAAVFFGRDAQIVRGLDEIRRLARTGVTRMFVILGASGSGKSSFLRAGLWPRLRRDDLAWLPIPIVRPERAAISGKYGLVEALYQAISEPRFADGIRQRGLPRSRAEIQDFIDKTDDGLARLLAALREIAQAGWSSDDNAAPLTTLIAVDQGEELFNEEGRDEATRLAEILTKTLEADPRTLALMVMRSDSFPLLQRNPSLAALPKDAFTLDMMLKGSYRAVIEGPARLVEPPLKIDPLLTDALLGDISEQDALPLLAFTLAHLYDNTRADNELTLAGYDKIGRVKGVIDKTVAQAFEEAVARGEAPKDEKAQLALARAAFIPHLAQVNAAGQFVRHVAARDQIPAEARPLIDRFADQRLLIRDRRKDADGNDADVLEVAHEALLRQPPFSEWLKDDREFLVWRERLSQARASFAAEQRGLLAGRELAIARSYLQARAEREIEPADQAFIHDSIADDDKRLAEQTEQARAKEIAEREEQERRVRDAEQIAAEQKKAAIAGKRTAQVAVVGLMVAVLVAGLALWQYFKASEATAKAQANLRDAQIAQSHFLAGLAQQQRTAEGDAGSAALLALEALPDALAGTARPYVPEAELQLDSPWRHLGERLVLGHADAVRSVAFSPDGRRIVTASWDKTARIWDAATGKPIGEPLKGHADRVVSAAFSPDGRRIVTASEDKTARMWDAATGQPISVFKGHADAVYSASFSPDGRRIVTGSDDNTARIWDAATGQPIGEPLKGHAGCVYSAAFSPDGTRIVTAFGGETAGIWDAVTGQPIGEPLRGHSDSLYGAAFSPDGRRIVTASADKTARLWDAATGQPIAEPLRVHDRVVFSAAFSPDGTCIATASEDGTARLWDATGSRPIGKPLRGHDDAVTSAAFSPDGTRVVTASEDGTARLWDAATGAQIGEPLRGHDDAATSAAFSPDGTRIVTASEDKTARIWDVATGAQIGEPLTGHRSWVNSAAFSPDGKRIVTASKDGTARLWDATTGQPVGDPLRGLETEVNSAAFSPDGKRIVTASWNGYGHIWDAESGYPVGEPLKGHDGGVLSAAFSPDGKRIVTASWDDTARIWDAATGQAIGEPLRGHGAQVVSAAFSPDGKRIVTASWDKTARIWDAATGQPIVEPLRGHEDKVLSAAFSPDGKRVVTASEDKTARIWDVFPDTEALVSAAKVAIPRCLTPEQRKVFFLSPEPPEWCIEMEKWPYDTPAWKQWLADVRAAKKPPLPAAQ
jgi:WD40 repeat protein